jgi:hypothetical protein
MSELYDFLVAGVAGRDIIKVGIVDLFRLPNSG